ncbi:hypothetical protein K504DRAFT_369020 [Pleomassaria siparia CBS 279.74]|uniref:AB hydrolase-1 domain-containing protein n=1 Tax=Pleomassaria siparia CBS 279.74 TaxID=1314801 RepID=A0A6G1KKP3_9PLEO|nr:hypothetical protein K504DRAFT_369020 [Pleomassaria siparia CBS 279.74]
MTSPSDSPPPSYTEFQQPPPLPPRSQSAYTPAAPPAADPSLASMASHDPRSSSTQSLVPDPATQNTGRRTLLLVYIHGFMGNETSFQSFPAHVHNLVTITLADSHIVHTKIYPRYRSRRALEVARDDFSKWLAPHETPWTDVMLLGHSMGGLLAADITLVFRHHIIGVVNFDVPFLGMHPGIVKAGLGSIFSPAPAPEHQPVVDTPDPTAGKRPSRMSTIFNPKPSDPNYNPRFANDPQLPVRKGWENTLHFINKHSNSLIAASKDLVKQHFEFGSAMADYRELKSRYARIRALEEEDERKRMTAIPEVRSGNLLSAVDPMPMHDDDHDHPLHVQHPSHEEQSPKTERSFHEESLPQEEATTNEIGPKLPEIPPIPSEPSFVDLAQYPDKAERKAAEKTHSRALKEYQKAVKERNHVIKERHKITEKWQKEKQKEAAEKQKEKQKAEAAALKEAEKQREPKSQKDAEEERLRQEADRMRKEAIRMNGGVDPSPPTEEERGSGSESGHPTNQEEKHIESNFGSLQLGAESHPQQRKHNSPYSNYDYSRSIILSQADPDARTAPKQPSSSHTDSTTALTTTDTNTTNPLSLSSTNADPETPPKKKRFKKFCMLPPKDAQGNKDPTWVRVFMEGMDEVTAHTSLFFVSESYERLVGDVVARIEEWVKEAESLRVVREMEGLA